MVYSPGKGSPGSAETEKLILGGFAAEAANSLLNAQLTVDKVASVTLSKAVRAYCTPQRTSHQWGKVESFCLVPQSSKNRFIPTGSKTVLSLSLGT